MFVQVYHVQQELLAPEIWHIHLYERTRLNLEAQLLESSSIVFLSIFVLVFKFSVALIHIISIFIPALGSFNLLTMFSN